MNKITKRILTAVVLAALLCCLALPALAAKDMGAGFTCSNNAPFKAGDPATFSWALTPSETYSRINVTIYSITDDVTTVVWTNDNANPSDSILLDIPECEKMYASASIFYTSGNYERLKSNTVKVNIPVREITFASSSLYVIEGDTHILPAVTVTPDYATNTGVSFYSDDTTIASFTTTGEIYGAEAGETVIYAKADDGYGAEAELYVTVLPATAPIPLKITKHPQSMTVEEDEEFSLSVSAQGSGLSYHWFYREPGKTGFVDTFCYDATLIETLTTETGSREYYCQVTDAYGDFVESNVATVTLITDLHIITQPKDVMTKVGSTVSFTVEAAGTGTLAYRWYVKTPSTNRFVDTKNISANYTFIMEESFDGNQYYCIVTDGNGKTVQSNTVTLRLPKPVYIQTQPQDVTVALGESASVSVEAIGEGLTYKWYYKNPGDPSFVYTSTFTSNTYTMTMNESRNGRQVYCVITDKVGNTVTTNTVTLRLLEPVRITKQPQSAMGNLGASVSVSVEATGEGLTYEWFYKNKGDKTFTYTSTYTSNTYTMTMTNARAGREVYCIVTDVYGNYVKSNTVVLDIMQPVYIRKQPENCFVDDYGIIASVTVDAVGDGLTYEWYYKPRNAITFTKLPAFTTNTYSVTMNEYDQNSKVYCIITDSQGNFVQTNIVSLGRKEAVAVVSTTGGKAYLGKRATITLETRGNGLTYKWYYKDPGAATYTLSSVTDDTYSLILTADRVGRQVYCLVTDYKGNTATSEIVTLGEPIPVYIKEQPKHQSVFAGEEAVVTFKAIGEGPLTYQWYFKPAGQTEFVYTDTFLENEYYVTMSEARDGRQVYCVVTDIYGNTAQTNTVTLDMKHRAAVIEQPKSNYVKAAAGEQFSVSIRAVGDGVSYQWLISETEDGVGTPVQGQISATFSATMNESLHKKFLYCELKDDYGTVVQSKRFKLRVVTPVEITEQPTDVFVKSGEKATVTLKAEGEGLTYKWYYKDKKATIFNLTETFIGDTYEVTMNSTRNGRQVYCVITDENGYQVTSNTVTLSMKTPLAITAQPQKTTALAGETVTVTIAATGDGLKYTWHVKEPGSSYVTYNNIGTSYSMVVNDNTSGTIVYCVVTDKYGDTVESDKVSVSTYKPVTITKQPEDSVKAFLGEKATVEIEVEATDVVKYEWYYKDANASTFTKTNTFKSNTYSVELTEARVGRQVYCVITDNHANKVTSNVITLKRDYTLKILKQPVNKTVNEGKTATVTVEVNGAGLTYQWYVIKAGTVEVTKSSNTTSKYSVVMNDERSGNQVFCVITDKNGDSVTSDTVTLKMPIAIKQQPVSVKVKSGETASVSVNATGSGLKYKWYYKNPGDSSYKASSVTGDTYSVTMNEDRDGRKVYCLITDSKGNQVKSNAVSLTMKVELGITTQPKSVKVASGQKATVSVKATGVDLKYQWYVKNAGTETFVKSSITSSKYSVTMNSARDGNQVYCVVTDKYGNTVKSEKATLRMQ